MRRFLQNGICLKKSKNQLHQGKNLLYKNFSKDPKQSQCLRISSHSELDFFFRCELPTDSPSSTASDHVYTDKNAKINIAVRCRPLLKKEVEKNPPENSLIDATEDQVVIATKGLIFRFDQVFADSCSQEMIYSSWVQSTVQQVNHV